MSITPLDMRQKVFVPRYYSDEGTGHPGPTLKTANGTIGTMESRNEHFMVQRGHKVSFTVAKNPKSSNEHEVFFKPPPPMPVRPNAVYLPFLANNVSSAVVPRNEVNLAHFFTDSLSGCAIFIDELPNGDLVVYHGNAAGLSPTAAETRANPAYEKAGAVAVMSSYHKQAQASAYATATPQVALYKSQYNRNAVDFLDRQKSLMRAEADVWGGTTVIGFKLSRGWEFWYQTYASTTPGGTRDIIACERFYS